MADDVMYHDAVIEGRQARCDCQAFVPAPMVAPQLVSAAAAAAAGLATKGPRQASTPKVSFPGM